MNYYLLSIIILFMYDLYILFKININSMDYSSNLQIITLVSSPFIPYVILQ